MKKLAISFLVVAMSILLIVPMPGAAIAGPHGGPHGGHGGGYSGWWAPWVVVIIQN